MAGKMKRLSCIVLLAAAAIIPLSGQPVTKPVPPPGIAVPAPDRSELEAGLARLRVGEFCAARRILQ